MRNRLLVLLPAVVLLAVAHLGAQESEPDQILQKLESYRGEWISEQKETPEGRAFTFSYRLVWFDREQSIFKMTIKQLFSDGEEVLWWEGFKGLGSGDPGVYYHAFSPSGRHAHGSVYQDGPLLVTEYDGYGPDGSEVSIKDEFTAVKDGRFRSVTYMWREGAWQEFIVDLWSRKTPTES